MGSTTRRDMPTAPAAGQPADPAGELARPDHPVPRAAAAPADRPQARRRRTLVRPSAGREDHQSVWLRALGPLPDDPLLHAAVLAYALDYSLLEPVLRRHGLAWSDPRLRVASLDHAMWFHRRPAPTSGRSTRSRPRPRRADGVWRSGGCSAPTDGWSRRSRRRACSASRSPSGDGPRPGAGREGRAPPRPERDAPVRAEPEEFPARVDPVVAHGGRRVHRGGAAAGGCADRTGRTGSAATAAVGRAGRAGARRTAATGRPTSGGTAAGHAAPAAAAAALGAGPRAESAAAPAVSAAARPPVKTRSPGASSCSRGCVAWTRVVVGRPGATGEVAHLGELVVGRQGEDEAVGPRAGRTAGTVEVGLVLDRRVRVDDDLDVFDVDAASRDVRRDEGRRPCRRGIGPCCGYARSGPGCRAARRRRRRRR